MVVTFSEWTSEAIDVLNGDETKPDASFSSIRVCFRDDVESFSKLVSIINAGPVGIWFLQSDYRQCFFPWSSIVDVQLIGAVK